jgi:hypothetical protein
VSDGAARRLAEALERRGVGEPARLLADAHRPLAPLLTDLAAAFGPLAAIVAGRSLDDVRAVLEQPDGLDRLTEALAPTPGERRAGSR